jgi:glycosyltransferase involved in cell wall biosynthesis
MIAQSDAYLALGYDVDFVFLCEPGNLAGVLPKRARAFNLGSPRLRAGIRPLARYLRAEQPDAVHAAVWPLTVGAIVARRMVRSRARLVVSDHSVLSLQYDGRGWFARRLLRSSIAATYRLADARIGVSSGVADDVAALSGIPRHQFRVIHNPICIPTFTNTDPAVAEAAWGGWIGKRILTVGHLRAVKNHALLIRAFKAVLASIEARLMILGTGQMEAETRALIVSENLGDKILLPGHVDDPAPYYRSADLFVLSSDYEGFGNVIVEALAFGLPVVSTDCPGGPAEILAGGEYGRLVPVGDVDALAKAMGESLAAPHDRHVSQTRAQDFTAAAHAEKYLELLLPDKPANATGLGVRRRSDASHDR